MITTWPLAAHLSHRAHDPFDPKFQAWTIDWVQHAIGHPSRLFDANIFSPQPATLAYSDSLIGVAVPLLPLHWLGVAPIGQLNVALLAGVVLSAAAGYAFGRVVTGSVVVGALAGAAFAFGGFGTYEASHAQTVVRAGVAVAATAAWWLADRARSGRRVWPAGVVLGGAIAWQCSVSFYTGSYALAAAAVVVAIRAGHLGRRGSAAAAGALAVAGGLALLLALPYLGRHAAIPGFHWTLRDLGPEGADFLHADSRLVVWGGLLGTGRPWPEFPPPLFPGVTLAVLGVVGAITAWRRGDRDRLAAVTGLALLVVGAVAAVGTSATGWRQYAPYRLVYAFAPGGQALRATFRAWMIGLLGLGLLAGLGARAVAEAVGRVVARRQHAARRQAALTGAVAVLAVVAIVAEGFRHWTGLAPVGVRPVDRVLASQAGPGGVLYLPVDQGGSTLPYATILDEADVVYRTTAHHRPTPNGYSGFFPASFFAMAAEVRSLPGQPALAYLQSIGVRYVVVGPLGPASPWARLRTPASAGPMRFIGDYDGDLLYQLPAPRS